MQMELVGLFSYRDDEDVVCVCGCTDTRFILFILQYFIRNAFSDITTYL